MGRNLIDKKNHGVDIRGVKSWIGNPRAIDL